MRKISFTTRGGASERRRDESLEQKKLNTAEKKG